MELDIEGHLRYLPPDQPVPLSFKALVTETMEGPPAAVARTLAKNAGTMGRALQKALRGRSFSGTPDRLPGSDYRYTVDSVDDRPNGTSLITITVWYETAGP
jgi:hypothetical protein